MTQSAVVEYEGKRYAFCKGAYEHIRERFRERSAPDDFMRVCEMHAGRSCYVPAMGWRQLEESREDAQSMTRVEVVNELDLLGLILFRNEPKDDTAAAISKLKEGDVRMAVVTGDNVLTGKKTHNASGVALAYTRIWSSAADAEGERGGLAHGARSHDGNV
jgi:cation-transporting ATPase 13A3/4/5